MRLSRLASCVAGILFPSLEKAEGYLDRAYVLYLKRGLGRCGKHLKVPYPAVLFGTEHMLLGENFVTGRNFRMEAVHRFLDQEFVPCIEVGDNFQCLHNVHIGAIGHLRIGNNVLIGSNVSIVDHNHGAYDSASRADHEPPSVPPLNRKLARKDDVVIGDNVWIGEAAIVLPGTRIGAGSVIGAHCVVRGEVPANTVVTSTAMSRPVRRYEESTCSWERLPPEGMV